MSNQIVRSDFDKYRVIMGLLLHLVHFVRYDSWQIMALSLKPVSAVYKYVRAIIQISCVVLHIDLLQRYNNNVLTTSYWTFWFIVEVSFGLLFIAYNLYKNVKTLIWNTAMGAIPTFRGSIFQSLTSKLFRLLENFELYRMLRLFFLDIKMR